MKCRKFQTTFVGYRRPIATQATNIMQGPHHELCKWQCIIFGRTLQSTWHLRHWHLLHVFKTTQRNMHSGSIELYLQLDWNARIFQLQPQFQYIKITFEKRGSSWMVEWVCICLGNHIFGNEVDWPGELIHIFSIYRMWTNIRASDE